MAQQMCVCGHPFSIHRLNREIGSRNECWATNAQGTQPRYCNCRQFQEALAATSSEDAF